MTERVQISVRGKVQEVLFRQTAKARGEKLNVVGWVRNEPDGSVLIVAEGEKDALQKLADWAKVGTEYSRVEKVDVIWQSASGEFEGFSIID